MEQSEHEIMEEIQLEAPKYGVKLFRNNVGQARGKKDTWIRFGLCVGSSDLIGWMPCGTFIAVEVKDHKGKPTKAQLAFIEEVKNAGGIGGICRSVADFVELINGSREV